MGELILCHEPIASSPYYIEGAGINIYSMEELCFYIAENTFLLDSSFMREELCSWIEREMGLSQLSDRLRRLMKTGRIFPDYVLAILEETGYFSGAEIKEIILEIREMGEKTDSQRNKLRADKLMEKGKYLAAAYGYKRLLESEAAGNDTVLTGNIWHNLGSAYAGMFLFEDAKKCFDRAYELNRNEESLRECLMCYRCLHDEEGFREKALSCGLDDMGMQEIVNELSIAGQNTKDFEERLEEIAHKAQGEHRAEAREEIDAVIYQWKEEYRRSCRV